MAVPAVRAGVEPVPAGRRILGLRLSGRLPVPVLGGPVRLETARLVVARAEAARVVAV
jgi:hypothetical protein